MWLKYTRIEKINSDVCCLSTWAIVTERFISMWLIWYHYESKQSDLMIWKRMMYELLVLAGIYFCRRGKKLQDRIRRNVLFIISFNGTWPLLLFIAFYSTISSFAASFDRNTSVCHRSTFLEMLLANAGKYGNTMLTIFWNISNVTLLSTHPAVHFIIRQRSKTTRRYRYESCLFQEGPWSAESYFWSRWIWLSLVPE